MAQFYRLSRGKNAELLKMLYNAVNATNLNMFEVCFTKSKFSAKQKCVNLI